jgi:hypothetical protein
VYFSTATSNIFVHTCGQLKHFSMDVAPVEVEYFPALHATHGVPEPSLFLYFPAGHAVHVVPQSGPSYPTLHLQCTARTQRVLPFDKSKQFEPELA